MGSRDSGDYDCPHCRYKTLRWGASRCPECHGDTWSLWERIRASEETRRREKEAAAEQYQLRMAAEAAKWRPLGWLVMLLILLAVGWFVFWLIRNPLASARRRPTAINLKTHVLAPGEVLVLGTTDDVILTAPAGMKKGACIYHAPSVRYFWTDGPSGEVRTAENCNGVWHIEGPGKLIYGDRLLNSIGVWNPTGKTVTLAIHTRP